LDFGVRILATNKLNQLMKTKALFLGVALAAVTAVQAQTNPVYSVNVVGYAKLNLPSGFSMICNPLNTTNNTIGALIPTFPLGGNLYKFNGTGFTIATYLPSGWDQPNLTLAPGEGCFVFPGTATTLIFSGEVLQGALTNAIPVGFSTQASKVPQSADESNSWRQPLQVHWRWIRHLHLPPRAMDEGADSFHAANRGW